MARGQRRWAGIAGLLLTGLFLFLALYRIDLEQTLATLARANYLLALPAAGCTLLGYALRATRWQLILKPTKAVPVVRLFPVLVIGFAANNLLPARLGELVRAYLVGIKEGISKSLSFATIVVERVLDGLTLVTLLLAVSTFVALPQEGRRATLLAAVFFVAALLGLLLLLYQLPRLRKALAWITRWAPPALAGRVDHMAVSFVEGVEALRQRRTIPSLVLLSLAVWILEGGSYWVLTWAFPLPLEPWQRPVAAGLVLSAANLGILIPSSPGYVGTFHFFAMSALMIIGVEREVALSYAIVAHATQYLLITGLGVIFLWRENLSLARLGSQALPGS